MTSLLRATASASLTAIALTFGLNAPAHAAMSLASLADSRIQFLPASKAGPFAEQSLTSRAAFQSKILSFIQANVDMAKYHHVGVQAVQDISGKNDHLLLIMHSASTHRADMAAIHLNPQDEPVSIEADYQVHDTDFAAQPSVAALCPDPSVQFIAFAPNNIALELQVTQDVASSAKAKGLKTVELYKENATRANYLAYMSCPNLQGNFYDGDANPSLITTADGVIGSNELANLNFNHHVTNIWLACQAFNDPMLSIMLKTNRSQKYAAGQNDLLVGPSDRTAACTMNAALKGQPMTAAFQQCYRALDVSTDHWGFDGNGSDYFGQ